MIPFSFSKMIFSGKTESYLSGCSGEYWNQFLTPKTSGCSVSSLQAVKTSHYLQTVSVKR